MLNTEVSKIQSTVLYFNIFMIIISILIPININEIKKFPTCYFF